MVARCDGRPIVWPEPTHGPRDSEEVKSGKLKPYHSAAECIDWNLPGNSIFGRKKPLSPNTLRRIARGLKKFVIDSADPFIVTTVTTKAEHCLISPTLIQMGYGDPEGKRVLDLDRPLGTITAGGNKFGLACAWVKKDYNNSTGDDVSRPLSTVTSQSNHHSLMTAHLAVNNTGHPGSNINDPVSTITTGGHQMLISSFLSKHYGGNYTGAGVHMAAPLDTITQVDHHSLIKIYLFKAVARYTNPNHNFQLNKSQRLLETNVGNSLEVEMFLSEFGVEQNRVKESSAFLVKYYGADIGQRLTEPIHTIPTKDRFGLIIIHGECYRIVDITLRMLEPKELARGQGVHDNYVLDKDKDGKKISKAKQVARIGNMVVPNCAEALVRSNLPEMCTNQPYFEQVELLNEDFGWSG